MISKLTLTPFLKNSLSFQKNLVFCGSRQFSEANKSSNTMRKKKTTQLKELLNSTNTEFIMEAHNGLSAVIVEESGFKGIIFSSFSTKTS